MNERLFQFIWQYSLYNPSGLVATNGAPVTVIFPGNLNRDAGPDFEEARIRVGDTLLVGNVELHVRTSDWKRHGHEADKAYQNIILHVVFHDDVKNESLAFPKLELYRHVPAYVLDQYTNLLQTSQTIPCAVKLNTVRSLTKEGWLSRLLAERWEHKLTEWKDFLAHTAGDWRKLLYWRMAANFGFKVNATPFLLLARNTPVNILAKHKDNLAQVEAILFGQAGMLDGNFKDDYPKQLQKEYHYLQRKYSLTPLAPHLWKFLRMRPANFPTIRIAQFAALVHRSLHLFSHIIEAGTIREIRPFLEVTASAYWNDHFRFDDHHGQPTERHLGHASIDNVIINTIAPIQFLYAHYHGDLVSQEKALELLSTVPPEKNNIITLWKENGWSADSAAETQPLIQLFNNYCSNKRCLECAIGLSIIRSKPVK